MQLEILLKQANLPDQAWILLMAHSGLRTCEIRALRWQDVDLKHQTIRIDESKGLRSRVVFMSKSAIQVLKQLSQPSEYVFTHHNQPLGNRYCQSRLTTLGGKCGIHVTPHQLRHGCASLLLNSGVSIYAVQAILGHKYLDTTLQYARTYNVTVAKNYKQAMKRVQEKGNM